jgi:hypothetical protein
MGKGQGRRRPEERVRWRWSAPRQKDTEASIYERALIDEQKAAIAAARQFSKA